MTTAINVPELRLAARQIWEAALDAANPLACMRKAVRLEGNRVVSGGRDFKVDGRLIVVGTGKAAARMAQAAEELFGDRISRGLVVTKHGHSLPLKKIRLIEAGHPIPDAEGIRGVEETRELLRNLEPNDLVICLISGGGSALWPSPAEGISLAQKQETTSVLLRAGATIRELNAVRKHLSAIKGGQLARWAAPARVISLIMSDVIGDPLDFIASGPTAPDTTSFRDALAVIKKYKAAVPAPVRERIEAGVAGRLADTPKPEDPMFDNVQNRIIANNRLLVDAAGAKARALGFNPLVIGTEFEGEAKDVGGVFAAIAREAANTGSPAAPPACILAAGETTVTVRGKGRGGRNQEMALAWALAMASRATERPCVFASVATDGSDGPTESAGGLVDAESCARAIKGGVKPAACLEANDSGRFLEASGDSIVTGPTQTNLMDLQILLVG